MTSREAQAVLLLYRPGSSDSGDPEMVRALELSRQDPELAAWFKQHCAFQSKVRQELRSMPVPPRPGNFVVPPALLITPLAWWRQPALLATTAAVALLLVVAAVWFRPPSPNQFANFKTRMVGAALREYRMDLLTGDMKQLRNFVSRAGGPADYQVTPGLEKLQLTGGGTLRWRSHPVSMVCFDRGDKQMLFLFVLKKDAVNQPPPETPRVETQSEMTLVSWTQAGNVYLLAGPREPGFVSKYVGGS